MSTGIQWTTETWNPLTGCSPVSEGCRNCYAAREAAGRLSGHPAYSGLAEYRGKGDARHPVFTGEIRLHPERLDQPLRWRKPRKVFVNSMSDLFHPEVPEEFVDRVWAVMALASRHTFQILTKRPERMAEYLLDDDLGGRLCQATFEITGEDPGPAPSWPLPNVWLGTSVEDQRSVDERLPELLRVPAAVRFLSAEPLLEGVHLTWWMTRLDREASRLTMDPLAASLLQRGMDEGRASAPTMGERLHWVIVGGESGPGARPFDLQWARSLISQCRRADVPVFVKQLGAIPVDGPGHHLDLRDRKGGDPSEWPAGLRVREWP